MQEKALQHHHCMLQPLYRSLMLQDSAFVQPTLTLHVHTVVRSYNLSLAIRQTLLSCAVVHHYCSSYFAAWGGGQRRRGCFILYLLAPHGQTKQHLQRFVCCCAQVLSNLAWSFAKLGYFEQELWDVLAATTIANASRLKSAELAQLSWAFCQAMSGQAAVDGIGQHHTLV